MRDKIKLTQLLHNRLAFNEELTTESLYSLIWKNIRTDSGFRLTTHGYELLSEYLDLEHYTIMLDSADFQGMKTLLALDRKLQHPYYIDYKFSSNNIKLVLFDSKEAMLANLYGNLTKFLDNYS